MVLNPAVDAVAEDHDPGCGPQGDVRNADRAGDQEEHEHYSLSSLTRVSSHVARVTTTTLPDLGLVGSTWKRDVIGPTVFIDVVLVRSSDLVRSPWSFTAWRAMRS